MIIFAAYIPNAARMVPELFIQVVILGVLATALIAYNSQFCSLHKCLLAVIGGCIAGLLVGLCLQHFPHGINEASAIAFVELHSFSVFGGCGIVAGGLGLALCSRVMAPSKHAAVPRGDFEE